MYDKPYELAEYMGRFGIFHNGHYRVAQAALAVADRLLIVVGSAQEKGTIRNPFDVQTRIEMIRAVFPDPEQVIIKALPDLTHEDDITHEWGDYVIDNMFKFAHKMPELMVYGNDESRSKWFREVRWTEIIVSRSEYPYSGTQGREDLLKNNRESWYKNHPKRLHKYFDRLRGELLEAEPYKRALNKLVNPTKPWSDYDVLEGQMDFD